MLWNGFMMKVRLRFFVKVDNFSVASAFEVEYAVVIPAMLVIQSCRHCCEKKSHVEALFISLEALVIQLMEKRGISEKEGI